MCVYPVSLKDIPEKTEAGLGCPASKYSRAIAPKILAARDQETTVVLPVGKDTKTLLVKSRANRSLKKCRLNHEVLGLEDHQGEIKIPYGIAVIARQRTTSPRSENPPIPLITRIILIYIHQKSPI